jgi:transposase-like protein
MQNEVARRIGLIRGRAFPQIVAKENPTPHVMIAGKNPACPAAVDALKAEGRCHAGFACAVLNKFVEQDHRAVKKPDWRKHAGSFQNALQTLQGIETMQTINKVRCQKL